VTHDAAAWDRAYRNELPPPWDIGHPQPRLQALARAGAFTGRVLDCGCGTGEHVLLAAEQGAQATGIDLSPRAIAQARGKAMSRRLPVRFAVGDALRPPVRDASVDVVIDSGLFHSFDDEARAGYVASLRRVVRAGGTCYVMCFSDRQPGDWGPRRVAADELRAAFADGWHVEVEPAEFMVNPIEGVTRVHAWLATLRRVS
jgi:SAM-dependent methyltransferase